MEELRRAPDEGLFSFDERTEQDVPLRVANSGGLWAMTDLQFDLLFYL